MPQFLFICLATLISFTLLMGNDLFLFSFLILLAVSFIGLTTVSIFFIT